MSGGVQGSLEDINDASMFGDLMVVAHELGVSAKETCLLPLC